MPSTVDLICIDPATASESWPLARGLIKSAIERTDLSDFDYIEREVLAGNYLLWMAISDHVEAAAVTQKASNVCTLVACAGHQMERWMPLRVRIEKYAKDEGCRCVRIIGRRGWERVLDGYHVEHVILEKAL